MTPRKRPGVTRAKKHASRIRNTARCLKCSTPHTANTPLDLHGPDHPQKPHMRLGNMVSSGYSNAAITAEIDRCHTIGGGWLCRGCHVKTDRSEAVIEAAAASAAARAAAPPRKCGRCRKASAYISKSNMCKSCQSNASRKTPTSKEAA
jgi:ribosomal protein S14